MLARLTKESVLLSDDPVLYLRESLLNFDDFFMHLDHHVWQPARAVLVFIMDRSKAAIVKNRL
jgi:hypothetical protein